MILKMKELQLFLVLVSLVHINTASINVCVSNTTITDTAFRNLINIVDGAILSSPSDDGIAKAVRLTFHDCVSGCNGCVDMENSDNIGLDGPVRLVASVYQRFYMTKFFGKYTLSRADFYALFGFRAIYLGSNLPGLTLPTCEFKIGRKDCTGPQDNKEIFANSLGNWFDISGFFQREFAFTSQEVVALMGAHTLGRTWSEDSNYTGPWVAFNNKNFTNEFYQNMLDLEGKLNYISEKNKFGKQQWSSFNDKKARKSPARVMLNSDLCLLKQFNVDTNGVPDCTYQTCKFNAEPGEWVRTYANNEALFKADFSKVFQKMLQHGYEGTNTLIDIIPNAATNNAPEDPTKEAVNMILKTLENSPANELFKAFHFIFKKNYDINTGEGVRRYRIFKNNLKIIKEGNEKLAEGSRKYGINFYTDMTFEEYFKTKFRVYPAQLAKFKVINFDEFSHLLTDA